MKKLRNLSDGEVTTISRQIADAFYDYKYNEEDEGLIKYIPSREGYLILSGECVGSIGFADGRYYGVPTLKDMGAEMMFRLNSTYYEEEKGLTIPESMKFEDIEPFLEV